MYIVQCMIYLHTLNDNPCIPHVQSAGVEE